MSTQSIRQFDVVIDAAGMPLEGILAVPEQAVGLVAFVHGSGSSRFSPRNQFVAQVLQEGGLATLLFDLLTVNEQMIDEQTAELRFDIPLLAERTTGAVDWLETQPVISQLPAGLFGASTGAAAALIAAAERPGTVRAVVSRGGRPDLAADALPRVEAPTLLIVGERDPVVLELNRRAAERMTAEHQVVVVPGASHLFEEPGTLEQAADLARQWFLTKLQSV